jgi:uncharacterized membrane protein YfcA
VIAIGYLFMILVGVVLGLIGGGGAILTMPVLVYLFQVPPVLATSYSLFIVGLASGVGVWRYHLQGLVDYKIAFTFLLPSFLGTYLARHILLPWLPEVIFQADSFSLSKDQLVMVCFSIVMVSASLSMIRSKKTLVESKLAQRWKQVLQMGVLGIAVGFVAGFVGAGGGFLIIPALVLFAGLSMTGAVPTSLLIIAINSLVAFAGDVAVAVKVNWSFLISSSLASVFGLLMGVKLSSRFTPASLKTGFGWFVLLMGAFILVQQMLGH